MVLTHPPISSPQECTLVWTARARQNMLSCSRVHAFRKIILYPRLSSFLPKTTRASCSSTARPYNERSAMKHEIETGARVSARGKEEIEEEPQAALCEWMRMGMGREERERSSMDVYGSFPFFSSSFDPFWPWEIGCSGIKNNSLTYGAVRAGMRRAIFRIRLCRVCRFLWFFSRFQGDFLFMPSAFSQV